MFYLLLIFGALFGCLIGLILSVPMLYRISFFILPILEKAPWEFANFRIIVYLCRTFAQKAKKQGLCSFLLMLEGWGLFS